MEYVAVISTDSILCLIFTIILYVFSVTLIFYLRQIRKLKQFALGQTTYQQGWGAGGELEFEPRNVRL